MAIKKMVANPPKTNKAGDKFGFLAPAAKGNGEFNSAKIDTNGKKKK
jgi:hypothetical protein